MRVERALVLVFTVASLLAAGCAPPAGAADDGAAGLQAAREKLYGALVAAKALDPELGILRMSHVCSLRIDGQLYPVVDLREAVKRALTAGGVNTIVVLSPDLKVVRKLEYTTQQPLYCDGNALFVFGALDLGDAIGIGNKLTVQDRGEALSVESVDVTALPLEASGGRKSAPQ